MSTDRDTGQPCIGCGRPTGAGSRLFSDRRSTRGPDGTSRWLCGDCNERAVDHAARQPGEHDMVKLSARASGLGMAGQHGAGPGTSTGA